MGRRSCVRGARGCFVVDGFLARPQLWADRHPTLPAFSPLTVVWLAVFLERDDLLAVTAVLADGLLTRRACHTNALLTPTLSRHRFSHQRSPRTPLLTPTLSTRALVTRCASRVLRSQALSPDALPHADALFTRTRFRAGSVLSLGVLARGSVPATMVAFARRRARTAR